MEFTTRFELQSQATRLFESASYAEILRQDGAITLLGGQFHDTRTGIPTDDSLYRLQFGLAADLS